MHPSAVQAQTNRTTATVRWELEIESSEAKMMLLVLVVPATRIDSMLLKWGFAVCNGGNGSAMFV